MSTLIQSAATIAAIVGVVKTTRWYVDYEAEKERKRKEKAFNLYVETGRKDEAFYSLSSRAIKTAERQRVRVVKFRVKETRQFTTHCECPQCCSFDVHSIKRIKFSYCWRECKECQYIWRQK